MRNTNALSKLVEGVLQTDGTQQSESKRNKRQRIEAIDAKRAEFIIVTVLLSYLLIHIRIAAIVAYIRRIVVKRKSVSFLILEC